MPVGHTAGHGGTYRPKITIFPRGTLLRTGTVLAALVNEAKTLRVSSRPRTLEGVMAGRCLITVMSLVPQFQKQHRHGRFLLDFGLLNLPGSSGRDIHSTWHCYAGVCNASSSLRSTHQTTAQETANIKSPSCTASVLHLTGVLPASLQLPRAAHIHRICWTNSRPNPGEEVSWEQRGKDERGEGVWGAEGGVGWGRAQKTPLAPSRQAQAARGGGRVNQSANDSSHATRSDKGCLSPVEKNEQTAAKEREKDAVWKRRQRTPLGWQ